MAVLDQFFCKMYFLYVSRSRKKNLGDFFFIKPLQKRRFFQLGVKCQNGGANVRMGVQRGIWFTFLIAALYWMIRVSKFNRDIFKLIAACSPSPLAISGAAGRLIFDTPVAGDDRPLMIMTIFE